MALSLSIELEASSRYGDGYSRCVAGFVVLGATGGVARHVAAAGHDGIDADARTLERGYGAGIGRVGGVGRVCVGDGPGDIGGSGPALDGPRGRVGDGPDGGSGRARRDRAGVPTVLSPWQRFVLGLDEALEELERQGEGEPRVRPSRWIGPIRSRGSICRRRAVGPGSVGAGTAGGEHDGTRTDARPDAIDGYSSAAVIDASHCRPVDRPPGNRSCNRSPIAISGRRRSTWRWPG